MTDRVGDHVSQSGGKLSQAGAGSLPFGTFRFEVDRNRLTWSEDLFPIFGFAEREVVPTLALMASHVHPDDRSDWQGAFQRVLTDARPFGLWHRIVDAGRHLKTLQTSVQTITAGPEDRLIELRGVVCDITDRLKQDRAVEVAAAVARSAETRAVIDQAKGMLMATMAVDDQQAFELLRWHSSHTNLKLRDIAAALVDKLGRPEGDAPAPRERLAAILRDLAGTRSTPIPLQTATNLALATSPSPGRRMAVPETLMLRTMMRAVDSAAASVTIADFTSPDRPLIYVNSAFEKMTGYPAEEVVGRNCRFLQGAETDPAQVAAMRSAMTNGREVRMVLRNYRRNGTPFWNELHLSPVHDDAGGLTHYIGHQIDVSEQVERALQLEQLAYRDSRTGLPNRLAALMHLRWAATTGTNFTILRIGLAGVRGVGVRGVGVRGEVDISRVVLNTATERLQQVLPPATFLAKLDEDEFLVLLPGDQAAMAIKAAESAFTWPIDVDGEDIQVTVAIGAADQPAGDVEALRLEARIDAARPDYRDQA